MKKYLLPPPAMRNITLFTLALAALVGCTSESFTGTDDEARLAQGETAITFGFDVPAVTRASGSEAATALGNQFIVYGEKSETADGCAPVTDGSTSHQLVFKNYVVNYTTTSAYTTTSNTKDWEYVGLTQDYSTNVDPQAGETQTIKYWDYSATNYVFTAFSAQQTDLSSGKVKVTKVTEKTDANKVYDKGYTVTLSADADPTKLYFSDRQVISQTAGTDRAAVNAYGGNVTFTFRNAISQIRVGMYETIDGYGVKIKKFYYQNDASPAFATMSTAVTSNFTANVPNLSTTSAATLNVTYYNEGTRQNQPKIAVSGTAANYITFAGSGLAADVTLATAAVTPTYDNNGTFTTVFPQETNDKSLKLKVDYQLFNTKTGETIDIIGATAEVPAGYLQWKPNYRYTYLFKISSNTNGSSGQGVVGLYPITFDAVSIEAEDGTAEYITTVSEPSITTFGVKAGKYQVGNDQYEDGSDVYATIVDAGTVIDPTSKYNVYTVTTTDATNFPITEASVAESLAETSAKTHKVTCTAYAGTKTLETTVPGEDGTNITLTAGKAIKLAALAAGTYAVEYEKTARTYKAVEVTFSTSAQYNDAIGAEVLYTDNMFNTEATASDYTDANTKFYRKVVYNAGTYAYKVIVVQ